MKKFCRMNVPHRPSPSSCDPISKAYFVLYFPLVFYLIIIIYLRICSLLEIESFMENFLSRRKIVEEILQNERTSSSESLFLRSYKQGIFRFSFSISLLYYYYYYYSLTNLLTSRTPKIDITGSGADRISVRAGTFSGVSAVWSPGGGAPTGRWRFSENLKKIRKKI